MSDLTPIGDLLPMEDRDRLRSVARTRDEVAEWEQERIRMERTARTLRISLALSRVHDAVAVEAAGAIVPDEQSREGIAWARRWTPQSQGACVWGLKGSGKTTLLCRMLQRLGPPTAAQIQARRTDPEALLGQGWSVCLASLPRLLPEVRVASRRGDVGALLDALGAVDVLVLDDLGRGVLERGWAQYLWLVLDARWSHGRRPLLVTSNIDPGVDGNYGLRCDNGEGGDLEVTLDRLRALAPLSIRYDCPTSRRRGA